MINSSVITATATTFNVILEFHGRVTISMCEIVGGVVKDRVWPCCEIKNREICFWSVCWWFAKISHHTVYYHTTEWIIQLTSVSQPCYPEQPDIQHTLTGRCTPRPHSISLTHASTASHQVVACGTTVGGSLSECCSSGSNLTIGWVGQNATVHNCWKENIHTGIMQVQYLALKITSQICI